jgi:anaphase-promoting complex subunit 3
LENVQSAENRYLLAISCFEQNKLVEAENALLYNGQRNSFDFTVAKENIPNGAAGLYLMGKICRRANRRQQAVEYLVKR